MFVISCKYTPISNYIIDLVQDIRQFHQQDKIVIVDSESEDKSYFEYLEKYNVIIEDINNKNWMIGAYWHTYKKYPFEDFYFFMHDSMRVKENLNFIKEQELTLMCYFDRNVCQSFNSWADIIKKTTTLNYKTDGLGCYGPIFFCKNIVMQKLLQLKVDTILPINKIGVGAAEGAYGFFFEELGYNLMKCSLFGDVLVNESVYGKSGPYPHNTTWQFPIEKFYGNKDKARQ